MQIARGLVILASTILNFVALHYLQLAQTVSIMFSTPLIVALLAGPILGEWVGLRRAIAIVIGFLGVIIVTQPGASGFHWAMLLSVVGAVMYAAGNIMARILVRDDAAAIAFFYVGAVGAVVMAPVVPFDFVWPSSPLAWSLILLMGAAGAIGHGCLILAHKYRAGLDPGALHLHAARLDGAVRLALLRRCAGPCDARRRKRRHRLRHLSSLARAAGDRRGQNPAGPRQSALRPAYFGTRLVPFASAMTSDSIGT